MNKLIIFSVILFAIVFPVSILLAISYILDFGSLRESYPGFFWGTCFFIGLFFINTSAIFFPVSYLQIISSIRKYQKANELDYKEGRQEPYLFDFPKLMKNLRKFVLWHYKDAIRDNRTRAKKKLEKKAKPLESL